MSARFADAYFLGPKSENAASVERAFDEILKHWFDWRASLFQDDGRAVTKDERGSEAFRVEEERLHAALRSLCDMLLAETPTFTPRYLSHMLSETSLPALFGYLAALVHNPNNTSREVSRVGAKMEIDAIAMLAEMLGFDPARAQGHFTSGGTVANFEAVWRARYRIDHALAFALALAEHSRSEINLFEVAHIDRSSIEARCHDYGISDVTMRAASSVLGNPFDIAGRLSERSGHAYRGPVLITPGNKHFSWRKAANVFHLGEDSLWSAPLDDEGRLDVTALRTLIEKARQQNRPVLAVVSVAGTTEAGEIDPVHEVVELLHEYKEQGVHIWHHVDAAYGGYFCSMLGGASEAALEKRETRALRAIRHADSVTIDPHKLGYVPYACGAFLTRDAACYKASSFHAPYIDRAEIGDKWQSTLEGSRSAAGAAATWLTGRTIGFGPERFGALLTDTIRARQTFEKAIVSQCPGVATLAPADTNILCFSIVKQSDTLTLSNQRTEKVFQRFQSDPGFSVSRTVFGAEGYQHLIAAHASRHGMVVDADQLRLIRCVFMNPFLPKSQVLDEVLPKFVARLNLYTHEAINIDAAPAS